MPDNDVTAVLVDGVKVAEVRHVDVNDRPALTTYQRLSKYLTETYWADLLAEDEEDSYPEGYSLDVDVIGLLDERVGVLADLAEQDEVDVDEVRIIVGDLREYADTLVNVLGTDQVTETE